MLKLIGVLGIVAICFYIGYLVWAVNVDGLLSRITRKRHKKILIWCNVFLIFAGILYLILEKFTWFLWKSSSIRVSVFLFIPCILTNFLILFLMHNREMQKLRVRNIVGTIIGTTIAGSIFWFYMINVSNRIEQDVQRNQSMYEYYWNHEWDDPVIDFTHDNNEDSPKVLERLKQRLERDDSDVNEFTEEYPHYAISSVCSGESSLTYEMLEVLIEHGADVNTYSEENGVYAPLMILCDASDWDEEKEEKDYSYVPKCVKLLLESGADPDMKDSPGDTALDVLDMSIQLCRFSEIRPEYKEECLAALEEAEDLLKQSMRKK